MMAAAWRTPRSHSAIAHPTLARSGHAPSPQRTSCDAFSSMCCRGVSSKCATPASLVQVSASACSSCSNSWGQQWNRNHRHRRPQHRRRSCVPNAESRCVSSAPWMRSYAARHETDDVLPSYGSGLPLNRPAIQFTAPGQSKSGQFRLALERYFLYNDSINGRSDIFSGISVG